MTTPGRRETPLVVCAGASITRGTMSTDYVALLAARLGTRFRFANAGRNGDLAFNLAQRLDPIVARKPDVVVLQIGTNDVNASLTAQAGRRYRRLKRLPTLPTLKFYEDNLLAIVARLRRDTTAQLATLSLPPLGEDLEGPENQRVRCYNERLRALASREGVAYLPLFEALAAVLERSPSPSAARPAARLIASAMLQHYLLGRSWDAIGARNGYRLLTDGIHLQSRAAQLVADCIETYLNTLPGGPR